MISLLEWIHYIPNICEQWIFVEKTSIITKKMELRKKKREKKRKIIIKQVTYDIPCWNWLKSKQNKNFWLLPSSLPLRNIFFFFIVFELNCTNYFTKFYFEFKYLNHIAWNDMLMWDESVCIIHNIEWFCELKSKSKIYKDIFVFRNPIWIEPINFRRKQQQSILIWPNLFTWNQLIQILFFFLVS